MKKLHDEKIFTEVSILRSVLNVLHDGVWLINSDFELVDFNNAFYECIDQALGVQLHRGRNILEQLPDKLQILKENWRGRFESGLSGVHGKFTDNFWIDNEFRTYEITTYPIFEHEVIMGLTIHSHETTKNKRDEEILKEKNEELSKINNELDLFVYRASHDLSAPLKSMKGLLNMVKVDPEKQNIDYYLNLIEASVNKLDHFITEIVQYSYNSRIEIDAVEIDFEALAAESLVSVNHLEEVDMVKSTITLKSEVDFFSDPKRLEIVFKNIITNAINFRDKKKGSFLKILIVANEDKAVIKFSDNGIGIHGEYKDKVFKMFYRGSDNSNGSGLGLYIVKDIVEKLGGTVALQTELGVGTIVTVEIPNLKELK